MALPLTGFSAAVQILRHRNYAWYWGGNFSAAAGMWMQRVAVGWLAWELTGLGVWLGAIAMADMLPSIVFGPIGGAIADRFDRLKLARLYQLLAALQSAALLALLLGGLLNIWLLLALTLFLGIVQAFALSVQLAIVPLLVPKAMLPSAVAFSSVSFSSARFVGPAIGGLVIANIGVPAAIFGALLTALVFLAALNRIELIRSETAGAARRGLFGEIAAGIRYAAGHYGIAAMLLLLVAISAGSRALTEVLPKFIAVVYQSDASGLATLVSAIGAGAMVSGLWMGARGNGSGLTRLAVILTFIQAAMLLALPFTTSLLMAVPIMVVLGFGMSAGGIANQTQLQLAVEGSMRGRVMSLYGMIFRGAQGIGALVIGYASDFFGIRVPIFVAGAAVVGVAGWAWLRREKIDAALFGRDRGEAAT